MTSTLTEPLEPAAPRPVKSRRRPPAARKLFDPAITKQAIKDSFVKLNPRTMIRNPVMFVVEVGSVLTTVLFFRDIGSSTANENVFAGMVSLWLWFTVLFANFAEAMAEGRGKAQAATLRRTRAETMANVRQPDGSLVQKASTALQVGDLCVVVAGEVIPGDGDVVEGLATVDESAITGESAPVIRESGGDRSAVTGGTRVLSDEITVRITSKPGETFLDRMIALVEGASRQKTPNEIALTILLAGLTIIFLLSVVTLQPFAIYSEAEQSIIVLVALLVCLIPTTIGALLSAIGIAGMDRLVQRNVLAMSGRAVEAAGDVNTLLLDKTGTITFGSRQAAEFVPVLGVDERRPGRGGDAVEPGRRDPGRALDRGLRGRALRPRRARGPGGGARALHGPDPDERDGLRGRPLGPQGSRGLGADAGAGGGGSRPDRAGPDRRWHLARRRHAARRLRSPGDGPRPASSG